MNARSLACLILFFALHGTAHAQSCKRDRDCQDGSWCNGVERCEGGYPNGMCMAAREPMCSDKKVCDEVGQRCLSVRKVEEKLTPCPEGQQYSAKAQKCVDVPRK